MKRSFDHGDLLIRDDGRTVEGRIVPYNEIADVTDIVDGEIVTYRECFLPGSLTRMIQAIDRRGNAGWMKLRMEHDEGFDARIGYGLTLTQDGDGGSGSFRLYESRDLDKIRSMLTESHTGLSVEFGDIAKPRINDDGVVQRVQVHIDAVAATPVPAYASAGITSMRGDGFNDGGTPDLDDLKAYLADLGRVPT